MNLLRFAVTSDKRPLCGFSMDFSQLFLIFTTTFSVAVVFAHEFPYGAALGWDSINYISVAHNLTSGNGFITFTDGVYINHPPLYPMLLALGSLFHLDHRSVANLIGPSAFGLTALISGIWMRRYIESRSIFIFGCLAIMLSLPLTGIAATALSEMPFICFTMLSLIFYMKWSSETDRQSLLFMAGIFCAFAFLTRYIGIALVVTICLLLILQRGVSLIGKIKHFFLFSVFQ